MAFPEIKRGDVFLTAGNSLLSRGIRWASRQPGEERTVVNHAGIVVDPDTESPTIVEALHRVRRHTFDEAYRKSPKTKIAIFRMKWLDDETRDRLAAEAEKQVGLKYGYGKIVLHALDKMTGGGTFFRNLSFARKWPICSYLVARVYLDTCGYMFYYLPPRFVQPDDIWDDVTRQDFFWEEVVPLTPVVELL